MIHRFDAGPHTTGTEEDIVIRSNISAAFAGTFVLAAAASVSAWDEYGPVAKGKTEVDLMGTYALSPEAGNLTPSLQVKYGVIDGLDVEVADAMPTDPEFGFGKPNIAVKYSHPETGLGGFVAVDLPFASEKIDDDPQAAYYFALQYTKTFGSIVLNDWAMFSSSFQTEDDGIVDLYVKPQYNATDKIGPYLGLEYITSGKFEGYTFVAKPGVNVILTDVFSVEAQVPVSKTKDVDDIGVGSYLGVYAVF